MILLSERMFLFSVRLVMLLALVFAVTVGFFAVDSLGDTPVPRTIEVHQGLVVFTGGTNRIEEGAKALLDGYEGPVLVTGVYPGVTVDHLFSPYGVTPEQRARITLDYAAQTTAGNVLETGKWAEKNNITTLNVVTSTYHTARCRLLFRRYMPRLAVTIHQVHPDRGTVRIWLKEYAKYTLVLLGIEAFFPATLNA